MTRGDATRPTPGQRVPACLLGMAILALGPAGCDAPPPSSTWTGTVRDSAGVSIITSPTQGLWSEGDAWRLEEDLRIGAFGGDLEYQFGQVGGIGVTSEGEILVSDRQAGEVRVFSETGAFVRAMGSPGSGPGQFSVSLSDVLISPGDTVLLPDVRNRRITRFGPGGELLESAPLDPVLGQPLRYDWNPTNRAMSVQLRPLGPADATANKRDAIRRIRPNGTFGDTLLEVPTGGLLAGGGITYFTPEPMWDVSDSLSVLYAKNSEYRVRAYDREGTLRRIIARSFEPKPITDRDIRAIFAYLDRAWLDAGVPASRLAQNRAAVSFAEVFPAFSEFHVGHLGSLWVQPVRSPGDLSDDEIERYNFLEDFGDSAWDVFDASGRFLGVVDMPDRFQPRLFVDDQIYGVWRDELDVQFVLRLRVVTP